MMASVGTWVFAQAPSTLKMSHAMKTHKSNKIKTNYTGEEPSGLPIKPVSYSVSNTLTAVNETNIGLTYYDLQSNGSVRPSLINHQNGKFSAVWTQGENVDNFPNRGTGYNFFDGAAWLPIPTGRIENASPNSRSGWPNILVTPNNKEINLSHGTTNDRIIQTSRAQYGTGAWSQMNLNSAVPLILWPRAVMGGASGNTVHLIGLTEPVANGGVEYNGMASALLYSKSTDGGVTYSAPIQIPGMDSSLYGDISADSYSIDSKGDKVVIAVGDLGSPVRLWTSLDNGATWTMTVVLDNGLTKFDMATTLFDDTLQTCGSSIVARIDNNNLTHVVFDQLAVTNPDGNIGLFMFWNFGLGYWNENMQAGKSIMIGDVYYDWNNDGLIGDGSNPPDIITGIDAYRYINMGQWASMPSMSIGPNNEIYITYSCLTEYTDGNGNYYRHINGMRSLNSGCSWTAPIDLTPGSGGLFFDFTNPGNIISPDADNDYKECVYASQAREADSAFVYMIFQKDDAAGRNVTSDDNVAKGPNDIIFKKVPVEWFDTVFVNADDCHTFVKVDDPGGCTPAVLTASCATTYLWSNGANTQSIQVSTTDTITLYSTNLCGIQDTTEVIIIKDQSITAPINGETTICGGSTILSTPVFANYTYNWSNGSTTNTTVANIGDVITLTVVDTACGYTANSTVTIMAQDSVVNAVITPTAFQSCQGQPITINATGGLSYVWSNSSIGNQITLTDTSSSGVYYAIATGACGNVDTSASVTITIHPIPAAPVITYNGSTLAISSNITNAGTHNWLSNGSLIGTVTGSVYSFSDWQLLQGKTICAIYIDEFGCKSDTSNCLTPIAIGVEDLSVTNGLNIYPNPSNGDVFVKVASVHNTKLVVRNILGQEVVNKNLTNNLTKVNLNSYGEGIYFFNVSNDKTQQTIKVTIK